MKRLIASTAIAVPLIFAAFVSQANAGITIRLGDPQDDYWRNNRDYSQDRDYRRDEYRYNLRRNSIFTKPNRNIRAVERRVERRVWIPDHWGYNSHGRIRVPGYYIYR